MASNIFEISEIKQESLMDDVRSSNTSLISSANATMKNCYNINQSAKHNEESCQGVARKKSLTEISKEKNGRSIDLNVELTPTGQPPKDRLSTNRCSEISSTSLSETSRMLLNQQDSSGEEVEFSNATPEEPSFIAMGCTRCLIFVLTSESNPKCANCQASRDLIDVLHYNPPKKAKNA